MGETSTEVGVMPKEITAGRPGEVHVEIGWTRNLPDVSMASINDSVGEGPWDPARGWFAHLDREGVNRLIRSLRKARDQAFGADA
jgi:hypothetical protein